MARNGSGTYVLPTGQPVVTGTTISSSTFNTLTSDLANALTTSIASDGQTTPTANLPMGGYRHTNVANGSARTDYAALGQVQDGAAQWLTGASGTDTITASISAPILSAYAAGQVFRFVSAGANTTTAVTLNINSLGAKSVTKDGATALSAGDIPASAVVTVVYDGVQFQLQSTSVANQISARGRENKIINPGMVIDQRNEGAAQAAITTGKFIVDRWKVVFSNAAVVTAQQSTNVPTGGVFQNSMGVTVTTADAAVAAGDVSLLQQIIEGSNITDLVGQTFTLQFWVRSAVTGTHCVSFRNSGNDRSYVAEYTINNANTWEQKSVTVAGGLPTAGTWNYGVGIGLNVSWAMMAGSTFQTTAGAWQTGNFVATSSQQNVMATTTNVFRITGVQLYLGSACPNFDSRSFQQELALCQRYYAKTFPQGTAPAQNAGVTGSIGYLEPSANVGWYINWRFPVEMRTTPATMTGYNTSAADANWSAGGIAIAFQGTGASGTTLSASGPTLTAGSTTRAHATAEAEL